MRYKITLGQEAPGVSRKPILLEAPWPTSSQERFLVASPEATEPRPLRYVRHLGVVVLQVPLEAACAADKDQEFVPTLEQLVRVRQMAVHWNQESGETELVAEVSSCATGVLAATIGYDLPQSSNGASKEKSKKQQIRAQMTGKVLQVLVAPGDQVTPETPLVVIEAMKMENRVFPARSGKVLSVAVKGGDLVQNGKELLVIECQP